MSRVPSLRVRAANARAIRPDGDYVLYWMTAARRTRYNFALDRAIEHAKALQKPLVVLEALRLDYPWASDRFHRFVIDGMVDNAARFATAPIHYHPYVEPAQGAGKGLVATLAANAAVVVTDLYPAFFLPRALRAAAAASPVLVEQVDSNGVVPLFAFQRAFTTARSFRIAAQKILAEHLPHRPRFNPFAKLVLPRLGRLPKAVVARWPRTGPELLARNAELSGLAIDHRVAPFPLRGGEAWGRGVISFFLTSKLAAYEHERDHPDFRMTSELSPWLHFGHVSAHEVLERVLDAEGWKPDRLAKRPRGDRSGFWGVSPSVEAFLEQLVTWRELGFNACIYRDDYDRFSFLPDFAHATLRKHAKDPRPRLYDRAALAAGATDDPIWNAAQRQLVAEGTIPSYVRMIWGKRVLEWTRTPEEAFDVLVELNDRFAVDGRDPNSYSGIGWIFGRYDRAWGPERPIFGTVRYMSSERARKKLHLEEWLARWS